MTNPAPSPTPATFRHEALLYAGEDEFLARAVTFIVDGVQQNESVLVVVSAQKIAALRDALNGAALDVQFADMAEVGHNPARIIPAWRDFVNKNGGGARPLRGIGEPISDDRSDAALAECHRHESLLNLAFAGSGDWWLLCPYDTTRLSDAVVEEAHRTHPYMFEAGRHRHSPLARGLDAISAPFDDPLPEAPHGAPEYVFDRSGLAAIRVLARDMGVRAGLAPTRVSDLALAVDEIATNSIRHGGGRGILRIWIDDQAVFCDIRDAGRLDDPLVGRRRPSPEQLDGRGMWLVNQLCELVQIRSSMAGTIVRLHVERH
jgi:anti-sigma regulatory factor (Ser/Thr protein kinase)